MNQRPSPRLDRIIARVIRLARHNAAFLHDLIVAPRAAIRRYLGVRIPEGVRFVIHLDSPARRHVVIPLHRRGSAVPPADCNDTDYPGTEDDTDCSECDTEGSGCDTEHDCETSRANCDTDEDCNTEEECPTEENCGTENDCPTDECETYDGCATAAPSSGKSRKRSSKETSRKSKK